MPRELNSARSTPPTSGSLANLPNSILSQLVRAAKLIESVLRSPVPNWDSVELGDISRTIERKKRQYSGLRSIRNKPEVSQKLRSIIEDVEKLYFGRAHKWASRSLADLNKEICRVETRLKERENSFDSLYLNALKSQKRSCLAPVATPNRRRLKPKKCSRVTGPSPTANPFPNVIQLNGAFSIEFCTDHTHFVKAPIKPGLQPCLIELKQIDGRVKLIDALTVLPLSVVSRSVIDPIYAAYLDLIGREYDTDIRQLSSDKKVQRLSVKIPDDPPFRCAALSATREKVFEALKHSKLLGEKGLKKGVAALVREVTKSTLWHPQHVAVERTAEKWPEAWAILARWDDWELRRLGWRERLIVHAGDMGKKVAELSREKDTLRKLCNSLGLRRGSLSPDNRLRAPRPLPRRVIQL